MKIHPWHQQPTSPQRRRFLEVSGKFGFTVATVAAGAGVLHSRTAVAQTAAEEESRQENAKHTMNVATAYRLGASRAYPIMQLDFKENIQNFTRGEVYVKLAPGGSLGVGTSLVNKVQNGTIQAGQHSLSNFAPFAPAVDLINIPYWCGENQRFVNLVTSNAWAENVNRAVEERGFKALWYVVIDPRVVAVRRGTEGPIKTPQQMEGIKFRVPGSKILQKVYSLMGANPTPIAWGETTAAIKEGVADALDPSVNALYVFGFKDVLSWVTFNRAVPDSQVFSCNLQWYQGLSQKIRDGIDEASDVTFRQNIAKVPAARAYSMLELENAGVQFYDPSDAEMEQWKASCGHQLDTWKDLKAELAGSTGQFDKFLEATQKNNGYYVA